MQVKFKKLDKDAILPSYAKDGDAGLDLTAISCELDGSVYIYKTGLAVEIPPEYVGLLFPRSSISNTVLMLSNSVGVIDSGYRGEVILKFNIVENKKGMPFAVGSRIAQLVIIPFPKIEPIDAIELTSSSRGTGGFGSTGN